MITPLQEQDGAWSMRRLLAFLCIGNAIKISWTPSTPYLTVLIFILAACLFLGFATFQEIKALATYKIADAVSGMSIGVDENDDETIGFKPPREKKDESGNTDKR